MAVINVVVFIVLSRKTNDTRQNVCETFMIALSTENDRLSIAEKEKL